MFGIMRYLALPVLLLAAGFPASAQEIDPDIPVIEIPIDDGPQDETNGDTDSETNSDETTSLADIINESADNTELEGVLDTGPDYSMLTPSQERTARLDALFDRLKDAEEDSAKLVAEEIWAIWADSGSASINLILSRGIEYEKNGKLEKARRMYDQVTTLAPDFAEGWARSSRLAMLEEDYNRALVDATQTLILEPREYYALWTMGTVLEKVGRTAQALEVYDCLLYTSPSPRDRTRSRMPSSA